LKLEIEKELHKEDYQLFISGQRKFLPHYFLFLHFLLNYCANIVFTIDTNLFSQQKMETKNNPSKKRVHELQSCALEEKDLKTLMAVFNQNDAKPISVQYFSDIYYDTSDFQLTQANLWLRERINWNKTDSDVHVISSLKLPSNQEIYEEKDIIEHLPKELQKTRLVDIKWTDMAQISVTRLVFKINGEKCTLDSSMLAPGAYILTFHYSNKFR
jgi:hypothetical protein